MRHHLLAPAAFCACLLLAACGADDTAAPPQATGEESLPKPDAVSGSVTGMPNPGTPAAIPEPADDLAGDDEDPGMAPESIDAYDPNLPVNPQPPSAEGAVAVPPELTPTMPAPTPAADPVESRVAPPPEP